LNITDKKPKILVLSAAVGAGHTITARALVRACEMTHPEVDIVWLDSLDLSARICKWFFDKFINTTIAGRLPHLYSYFYDSFDREEKILKRDTIGTQVGRFLARKFLRRVAAEKPDIIICTHFQPGDLISVLKRKGKISCPVGVVVTDYYMHSFWEVRDVDFFVVSSEEMKSILVEKGYAPAMVHVLGVPVRPDFITPVDRAAILKKLDCMEGTPIVMTIASGWRKSGADVTVQALMQTGIEMQILAVAGRNKTSEEKLRSLTPPPGISLKVFGFVDHVHEMMRVSDVLVAKPGGVTVVEALAVGLPMIATNPVPGQEMGNCHYLERVGAGVLVNRLGSLKYHLREILGNKDKRERMRAAAMKAGHPRAAFDIIDLLLDKTGKKA
jgi:processive 1,2-diacylglycerol beta-glucosyltransferase